MNCRTADGQRLAVILATWRQHALKPLILALGAVLGLTTAVPPTMRPAAAADLVTLTPENWDEFVPQGKEVDAIYGDYVLRNEQIVLVVARPVAGRNANLTVKAVGGCLLDLTRRDRSNDQLSAYFPGGSRQSFTSVDRVRAGVDPQALTAGPDPRVSGPSVTLECTADPAPMMPTVAIRYTLADGQPFVRVESLITNASDAAVSVDLADAIRADRVFEFGTDAGTRTFWAADDWFGQAYGVRVDGFDIKRDKLLQLVKDGQSTVSIGKGETFVVSRQIFPADHLLALRGIARKLAGQDASPATFTVVDPAGPVVHAKVTLSRGAESIGSGRTDSAGRIQCDVAPGEYQAKVEAIGRPALEQNVTIAAPGTVELKMQACGYVVGKITDAAGQPIPCKVALFDKSQGGDYLRGQDRKYDPKLMTVYFGPDSGDHAVHNLIYTPNGTFRQEVAPGKYEAIVTCGPEYHAVFVDVDVKQGGEAVIAAKLTRAVDTTGWISTDFHSHSSPSGDNISSQRGRVLNLIAEHIEFAPCTEHQRVDSYVPHLKALGVEHVMGTCPGIELTGAPLPINHQNAFPLVLKPRTQNGGGPEPDVNPITQIERLALWDNNSDKLVQQNHPNLYQMLLDKDLDGKPDGGFEKMFGFMDVVEVHPPASIFKEESAEKPGSNTMQRWMDLLNRGYRIPGVVNTDAHYNFHGSGWLRNYVKSETDDPARVEPLDVAHASERGNVVMTNGPFLEVEAVAQEPADRPSRGIPGDIVVAPNGKLQMRIRVQCANWLDVNRVQVFINGKPDEKLNFTRRSHPDQFGDGVLKFSHHVELELPENAHVIVATIGEGLSLGRIMGPDRGVDAPVAVANPVWVKVKK